MAREVDLGPIQDQISAVEAEIKSPLPTPPVGTLVVWYPRAARAIENQIAGIVTRVEGPGKITLTVFRPQGVPELNHRGCLFVDHPIHEKRANSVSVNSGSWEYPELVKPDKSHFDLHLAVLNKKRDSLKEQVRVASEIKNEQKSKGSQTQGAAS